MQPKYKKTLNNLIENFNDLIKSYYKTQLLNRFELKRN